MCQINLRSKGSNKIGVLKEDEQEGIRPPDVVIGDRHLRAKVKRIKNQG